MIRKNIPIELLAPAKDKISAISAVNAGADAVYIGYRKFGARKNAGNSLEDIAEIVRYADVFRVKVYVTLNTIYSDDELTEVVDLIYKLYDIGVSAIIVQDMGILEQKLPPIKIFASTQCHNNTVEKVKFLEQTGFDRVILPREFSLDDIKNITDNTEIEVETFIHGALCVSYSGQCYLSYANGGRSANRGECAQPCRKKYTLTANDGTIIEKDKYLLSLKDLNLSAKIKELILAGVTSFKIEGRLKDEYYVKNVVAYYRREIDRVLDELNLKRASVGTSFPQFEPNPYKSFNRGFTEFFADGKRKNFCTKDYVKSTGEYLGIIDKTAKNYFTVNGISPENGDGLCFLSGGELLGVQVIKNDNGKIFSQNMQGIKEGIKLFRNSDVKFQKELEKPIARKIFVTAKFYADDVISLTYTDEENNSATVTLKENFETAKDADKALETIKKQITKTGDSEFVVQNAEISAEKVYFVRTSVLNELRRQALEKLREERQKNLKKSVKTNGIKVLPYPLSSADYRFNISNKAAENFYSKRGVKISEYAVESNKNSVPEILMQTKHCIKYTLGLCKKYFPKSKNYKEPFFLIDEFNKKYLLDFDCKNCQMFLKCYK